MFEEKDLNLLEEKGISLQLANWQIEQFNKGVTPINIVAPATLEKGITAIEDLDHYVGIYKDSDVSITKFVPASGAASRMFKALFEFYDENKSKTNVDISANQALNEFFSNIKKFAFYPDLDKLLEPKGGLQRVIAEKRYILVLKTLLEPGGLSYGSLPKGLLKFHFYAGNIGRTPFEEHLVEGARYAASKNCNAKLHFTVSPEHIELFKKLLDTVLNKYEDMYRVKYEVSFSVQKPSTDTLAVKPDNTPFYDKDGKILFRPGGHGALIENLNDIDSDIIYIKNIDNVIPEKKIDSLVTSKRALAGMLISVQGTVFELCEALKNDPDSDTIQKAKGFLEKTLNVTVKPDSGGNEAELMLKMLNKPLRVCGMVKNEGEPGGGPFFVKNSSGVTSLQIVESSQVDSNNEEQLKLFNSSTHFNPVDLVCAVKDFEGNKFDLKEFVDNETCFISKKSKNGKELKALELPGLWNGAMANWNTIFVEVPVNTFNPVKTVNDLLRDAHQ